MNDERRSDDEQPQIILHFAGDAEPKTLQALSRELAAWTDHFAVVAHLQGTHAVLPLAGVRRGSLVVALVATAPFVLAVAAVWNAVLGSRKDSREKEGHGVDVDIKRLQREKLLRELRATEANDEARRMLDGLLRGVGQFQELGGRILFEVPEPLLRENPELRKILEAISTDQVLLTENGGVELVPIPGGTFGMGSPESAEERSQEEGPPHLVTLSPFYLGRYPVTNEEYGRFLKANPAETEPAYWSDQRFNQPRQPVVGVSWEQAERFAQWAGWGFRPRPSGSTRAALAPKRAATASWMRSLGTTPTAAGSYMRWERSARTLFWPARHAGQRVGVVLGLVRPVFARFRL